MGALKKFKILTRKILSLHRYGFDRNISCINNQDCNE